MKENSREEIIKQLELILKVRKEQKEIIECAGGSCMNCDPDIKALTESIKIVSDYKRVLKENEHKTEKIEKQKAELAILNNKQKDFNKLQNTLKSYKGQFRRQEKENEKINSLIRKLKKDSKERQWIQTADDEYLAHTEKAMYADELLSFLRGEE